MKRQNLKNKEIDQIGSRLLKVTKPSGEEIEKIVSNPQLFDSIQMRIKAEERLVSESKRLVNWSWLKSSFVNRQLAISAVAILVVFIFFAVLIVIDNQESTNVVEEKKILKPQSQSEIVKTGESSNDSEIEKDFAPTKFESEKEIVSKKKNNKLPMRIRKTNSAKTQQVSTKSSNKPKLTPKPKIVKEESLQVAKKEPQKIFYSLPFAENSETGNENLQVVSTKLSRSELFALGVNLQLENENSTVETELLVGDNGVARAIRVVEKY